MYLMNWLHYKIMDDLRQFLYMRSNSRLLSSKSAISENTDHTVQSRVVIEVSTLPLSAQLTICSNTSK